MKSSFSLKKIFANWPEIVICFLVALFLYFYYQGNSLESKNVSIPLELRDNGQFTNVSRLPKYVRIKMRGKGEDVTSVKTEDIEAFIDISNVTNEGSFDFPIELSFSEKLTAITPIEVEVEPSVLKLKIEEKIVDYVPIEPIFTGKVKDGYSLNKYVLVPDTIKISGAKSHVEAVKKIQTTDIRLFQLQNNITQIVSLQKINSLIDVDNKNISVKLYISANIIEKTFNVKDVTFVDVNDNFVFSKADVNFLVKVSGTENFLKDFEMPVDTLKVNCSNIDTVGTYELPIEFILPAELSFISIEPTTITVLAEEKNENNLVLESNEIITPDTEDNKQLEGDLLKEN